MPAGLRFTSDLTELKESEQRAAAANLLILQSLRYARRIQAAILPQGRELATVTADHFLIWEPRDIVGGDVFWFQPIRDDGLEAGVCFINPGQGKMTFAGARFSLWRANETGVAEIRGDRRGVGYRRYPKESTYTDVTLRFTGSDSFYLTTDGMIDQIGGPRGRSFGKSRFQALLKKNRGRPMQMQAEAMREELARYQGQQIRRDDLTVLGFVPLGG